MKDREVDKVGAPVAFAEQGKSPLLNKKCLELEFCYAREPGTPLADQDKKAHLKEIL